MAHIHTAHKKTPMSEGSTGANYRRGKRTLPAHFNFGKLPCMNLPTPLNHLNAASKLYPQAWKQVEHFLSVRGKEITDWPPWCFLPMAGWYAIVSGGGDNRLGLDQIGDVGRLAAIGTWRYTQGICRFDSDFAAAITDTILSGEMPVEVLYRLPQWCVYIETPGQKWIDVPLHGFWVHLEYDVNNERTELRLVLDAETALVPLPIHLGPWPFLEAVSRAMNEAAMQGKIHGRGHSSGMQTPILDRQRRGEAVSLPVALSDTGQGEDTEERMKRAVMPCMVAFLWYT